MLYELNLNLESLLFLFLLPDQSQVPNQTQPRLRHENDLLLPLHPPPSSWQPICTKETLAGKPQSCRTYQRRTNAKLKSETRKNERDSYQFRLQNETLTPSPLSISTLPPPSALTLTTTTRFCTEALQTETSVIAGGRSHLPNQFFFRIMFVFFNLLMLSVFKKCIL